MCCADIGDHLVCLLLIISDDQQQLKEVHSDDRLKCFPAHPPPRPPRSHLTHPCPYSPAHCMLWNPCCAASPCCAPSLRPMLLPLPAHPQCSPQFMYTSVHCSSLCTWAVLSAKLQPKQGVPCSVHLQGAKLSSGQGKEGEGTAGGGPAGGGGRRFREVQLQEPIRWANPGITSGQQTLGRSLPLIKLQLMMSLITNCPQPVNDFTSQPFDHFITLSSHRLPEKYKQPPRSLFQYV